MPFGKKMTTGHTEAAVGSSAPSLDPDNNSPRLGHLKWLLQTWVLQPTELNPKQGTSELPQQGQTKQHLCRTAVQVEEPRLSRGLVIEGCFATLKCSPLCSRSVGLCSSFNTRPMPLNFPPLGLALLSAATNLLPQESGKGFQMHDVFAEWCSLGQP